MNVEQVTLEYAQINLRTLIIVMELTLGPNVFILLTTFLIVWCSADVEYKQMHCSGLLTLIAC